ncbi:hypothetical protein [Kitasatospora sp. LaBMicrA B282]|uniref:hypothetical protein n=1 Tax=Kitasatospora sp. LaBMicrA B282 TaxID=3420949 RepID=UPI003D0D9242
MAGQFPGQFGPAPVPPAGPAKGPFGIGGKVLFCLIGVGSIGLLGFVPALALAIRHRRRADVAGAVVFAGLWLLMVVCAAVAGANRQATVPNTIGMVTMVVLILAAPTHFLLMDRRGRTAGQAPPGWGVAGPNPEVLPYPPARQPAPPYQWLEVTHPQYAQPQWARPDHAQRGYAQPTPPPQPVLSPHPSPTPHPTPVPPVAEPADRPVQTPTEELRQLGELLRRQAEGGQQ